MTERGLAIVPAYNEAANVGAVVAEIRAAAPEFDILVIDDGSTDDTLKRAEAAGARVIRHPFNLGIGGAVQSGYLFALEHGYRLAVQIDGDGQHDPRDLRLLVDALTGDPTIDLVYGSRFLADGSHRTTRARRAGIVLFSLLLSAITRQRVTDPTSGYRLCNRRAIELFARDYPHDYPEVEAILMMHTHQLRCTEVAVNMRAREGGVSSINMLRSAYYMIKVTLAVFVGLCRSRASVAPGDAAPVSTEHGI